jgi:transposase
VTFSRQPENTLNLQNGHWIGWKRSANSTISTINALKTTAFKKEHEKLVAKTDIMAEERDASINEYSPDAPDSTMLTDVKFKVLTSLKKHWHGLTVFVEHPEVPMDNNNGEQSIRNPVTGRKNFYGSGSLWSSELAAMMFSIFQTLVLCGLNCHHWLRLYLTACAENNGKPTRFDPS